MSLVKSVKRCLGFGPPEEEYVAGILTRLDKFDMDEEYDRRRGQAAVQLLKGFDIDLRYSFKWFYSGKRPYSSELYDVFDVWPEDAQERVFTSEKLEDRFSEFQEYLECGEDDLDQDSRIRDLDRLEVAASLSFVSELNPEKGSLPVFDKVKKEREEIEDDVDYWEELLELEKFGAVPYVRR